MKESAERTEHLCPSAPATEGAILLGIVGPEGQVGYVQPLLRIDADFLVRAHARGAPEERFRFSSPCVEARCGYWTGSACGVIEQVLQRHDAGDLPATADLPHCMIRSACRWYAQAGREACGVCPYVVTRQSAGGDPQCTAEISASVVPTLTMSEATAVGSQSRRTAVLGRLDAHAPSFE